MRIEEVYLREVGPFDELRLEFPPGEDPERADVYLLTGPNGSGKSTLLYALAGALTAGTPALGRDLGARRLRSVQSLAFVRTDKGVIAEAWSHVGMTKRHALEMPDGTGLGLVRATSPVSYYGDSDLVQRASIAANYTDSGPQAAEMRFDWAAFAYAGMRSVAEVKITTIQEPTTAPFTSSLSFVATADASQFAQWVANQEFKRLKAKEAGRLDKVDMLRRSIDRAESIVSAIIDEPFRFVTSYDDNNVRGRLGDRTIDLELLPDGLKSIVSWVADLLMRLDRIPWVDDTPPQDREFLLLLDEVDIHLHPAWQRKVLPIVQQMFPKAQIIASTHSPFVVASAVDARIITLALKDGVATVERNEPADTGVSYSAILRSIFGITSEFDVDTEEKFKRFHEVKQHLLAGDRTAREELDALEQDLASRSEEVRELIALEMRQLDRQLTRRGG